MRVRVRGSDNMGISTSCARRSSTGSPATHPCCAAPHTMAYRIPSYFHQMFSCQAVMMARSSFGTMVGVRIDLAPCIVSAVAVSAITVILLPNIMSHSLSSLHNRRHWLQVSPQFYPTHDRRVCSLDRRLPMSQITVQHTPITCSFQEEISRAQPGSLDSEAGIYAAVFDHSGRYVGYHGTLMWCGRLFASYVRFLAWIHVGGAVIKGAIVAA